MGAGTVNVMTTRLELDHNEREALLSALEAYLNHDGMPDEDEDEPVLEALLVRLSAS